MEPLLGEVCDLLALDHATVADEGDLCDAKPGLDLVELRSKGLRILGIAWKDFDGDRRAGLVAEEAANSVFEVSHWFDQCDLNSFERSGSRVLPTWLDEPTQGELHVRSLSEPDPFPVELQVSYRLRAQTAA